jgi:deoxyribonuclease-4
MHVKPLLGAHMSIAGGIPKAVDRAVGAGCTALQIFVKNASQWKGRPLPEDEVEAFRTACRIAGLKRVVGHDSYLINLASPDDSLWERSQDALIDEIQRSTALGLSHLVVHPGAHLGSGETRGVERIADAIDRIHERLDPGSTPIALETTAGQGTSIGHRFEHLRDILGNVRKPERVGVCVDSCHVFAAGYDLRTPEAWDRTVSEFDRVVGLDLLRVLHVNDSKRGLGSRVDRHQHIGDGEIGNRGFYFIMNEERLCGVPKILETPKGKDGEEDRRNLAFLRSMIGRRRC